VGLGALDVDALEAPLDGLGFGEADDDGEDAAPDVFDALAVGPEDVGVEDDLDKDQRGV
jgi:hypothetical protein